MNDAHKIEEEDFSPNLSSMQSESMERDMEHLKEEFSKGNISMDDYYNITSGLARKGLEVNTDKPEVYTWSVGKTLGTYILSTPKIFLVASIVPLLNEIETLACSVYETTFLPESKMGYSSFKIAGKNFTDIGKAMTWCEAIHMQETIKVKIGGMDFSKSRLLKASGIDKTPIEINEKPENSVQAIETSRKNKEIANAVLHEGYEGSGIEIEATTTDDFVNALIVKNVQRLKIEAVENNKVIENSLRRAAIDSLSDQPIDVDDGLEPLTPDMEKYWSVIKLNAKNTFILQEIEDPALATRTIEVIIKQLNEAKEKIISKTRQLTIKSQAQASVNGDGEVVVRDRRNCQITLSKEAIEQLGEWAKNIS